MTNAALNIKISLLVKTRSNVDRFRPSTTFTETWSLDTTIDQYKNDLEGVLDSVWAYAQAQRAADHTAEVGCRFSIRIENVTAPTPPAGAWVQAKQHYDGALSDGDFTSTDAVKIRLYNAMDNSIAIARY